jgi:protein ImuB
LQLPRLIDRLAARFGAKAIRQPALLASHVPERAESWDSALPDKTDMASLLVKERPIRLLTTPEEIRVLYAVPEGPPAQFIWRRQTHRVARYEGPERIAPEWWKDRPGTRLRDYFKIEDQTGRRFWLYREGLHA